jgi:hypothetical protein
MTFAVLVQDRLEAVAALFDVDLGAPEGPETIRGENAAEDVAETLFPLLNEERSEASVLVVAAACVGALREGLSPRAWLKRVSENLPSDVDDAREMGTLGANPEAVRAMWRAATRLRGALNLDRERNPLQSQERGPYAQLFDISADE